MKPYRNFIISNADIEKFKAMLKGYDTKDLELPESAVQPIGYVPNVVFTNTEKKESQIKQSNHYWLDKTVQYALDATHFSVDEKPRILSIGTAGSGLEEYHAFISYFGIRKIRLDKYVAIDISEKNLQPTRRYIETYSDVTIICDDARKIPEFLQDQYDIVIAGHPDCEISKENIQIWSEIFRNVKSRLKDNSRLISVSYTDFERNILSSILNENRYNILLNELNPFAGDLLYGEAKIGKYLTVARK